MDFAYSNITSIARFFCFRTMYYRYLFHNVWSSVCQKEGLKVYSIFFISQIVSSVSHSHVPGKRIPIYNEYQNIVEMNDISASQNRTLPKII